VFLKKKKKKEGKKERIKSVTVEGHIPKLEKKRFLDLR